MKQFLAIAIFICGGAVAADGGPPGSFGFKSYVMDKQKADLDLSGLECAPRTFDQADECTLPPITPENVPDRPTIAGIPIWSLSLIFEDQRLTKITIQVMKQGFDPIVVALEGKYGAAKKDLVDYQNGFGTTFTKRVFSWKINGGSIAIGDGSARSDYVYLNYVSPTSTAAQAVKKAQRAEQFKNDL